MDKFINKAATLIEALPYLKKFRGQTFVFKYGGHAMSDQALQESFLLDLILLKHVGIHPVVVHGGGPQIEATLKELGIESKYVNGLRVTDKKTMEVVEMVLVGKVNSQLVNLIQKMGGVAVGYSGTDGNMFMARKLKKQKVKSEDGSVAEVDLGMVGEIIKVNPQLLKNLIQEDMFIPVISPIGLSESGESLNINADTAACELAKALKAAKLILLTDVQGVLDDKGALIPDIDIKSTKSLIEKGIIKGGMIPKVESALDAIHQGVDSVAIIDGKVKHAVLLEIFTDTGVGTLIHGASA